MSKTHSRRVYCIVVHCGWALLEVHHQMMLDYALCIAMESANLGPCSAGMGAMPGAVTHLTTPSIQHTQAPRLPKCTLMLVIKMLITIPRIAGYIISFYLAMI